MHCFPSILLALIVGTWNGEWFPSGRAEHRGNAEVEAATIAQAGKLLRRGIEALDPQPGEDVVLCLNEIRDPTAAKSLCRAVGISNLTVSVISGYRRRDRFDQQQDVIMSTLPMVDGMWGLWKREGKTQPPRGYVRADFLYRPSVTARVYAVHLKSNYGATTAALREDNRAKRTLAVRQLLAKEAENSTRPTIVGGDFNADKWRREFSLETIFADFEAAGWVNVLAFLPPTARGTHPSKRYGDSALDYLMLKDFSVAGSPMILDSAALSDHNPVFVRIECDKPKKPR